MRVGAVLWRVINPLARFEHGMRLRKYDDWSDEKYIKKYFKLKMGRKLDLNNPQTFCEKLQWLKLYDHNPQYTIMVDKYEVKKFVSEKIGEQYVVPLYGVWNSFDEIDFDSLPEQFVLKCTHNSGGYVVCKNKSELNMAEAKKTLEESLQRNYYYSTREWAYKNVKPRIIAEKYIPSLGSRDSKEYKLTCFNGRVGVITICTGIAHAELSARNNDNYDRDFNFTPWYAYYENTANPIKEKPVFMDEMIRLAEIISSGIPQVRVDFYVDDNQIYFGEATFYTWAGHIVFTPPEWDKKLGDMIELPEKE